MIRLDKSLALCYNTMIRGAQYIQEDMQMKTNRLIKWVVLFTVVIFIAQNVGLTYREDLFVVPVPSQVCACECGPPPCKCTHVFYDGPWIVCCKEVE